MAQLRELVTNYGPLSEIWFDMGHSTALQSRRFADTVHQIQPQCLISGRVWNSEGDFSETGDDDIPEYITDEPWESPLLFLVRHGVTVRGRNARRLKTKFTKKFCG